MELSDEISLNHAPPPDPAGAFQSSRSGSFNPRFLLLIFISHELKTSRWMLMRPLFRTHPASRLSSLHRVLPFVG
ncbi:unnamed protein product [Periconia digitata]|uniref:Uncharacterized protein n=1 Tax=Periconia digitata TaxID=1303443 RepID=A0A9W4U6C3_9PLEO|nr:unnamed protein product [Periconia digitata]